MSDRNRLFISYSHDDTKWLEAIREQLKVLEAEGLVSICDDSQLQVGEDWYQQLNEMMLTARLGLLLISAPFLNSKFVREGEIPRLFDRHEQSGMKIYPLLVEPCPWRPPNPSLSPHSPVIAAGDAFDQSRIASRRSARIELDPHASISLRADIRNDIDTVTGAADLTCAAILRGDLHPLISHRTDRRGPRPVKGIPD